MLNRRKIEFIERIEADETRGVLLLADVDILEGLALVIAERTGDKGDYHVVTFFENLDEPWIIESGNLPNMVELFIKKFKEYVGRWEV